MIVVMQIGSKENELNEVCKKAESLGFTPHIIYGKERNVVGLVGLGDRENVRIIEDLPGVDRVVPITKPYKLSSREVKKESSIVEVGDVKFGGEEIVVIAGPCSVESEEQIVKTAEYVKAAGAKMLRGGAFKPRTSPYAFQGLGEEGLKLLAKARDITGLPVVTEVVNPKDVDLVYKYTDMFQVGARNIQNFALLTMLGQTG
ncbi:MAG: 3-deoxy-7-phosphoheptulonate synthase, partial [Calditerrivibrio sp.]|nr:3-deoxy-7-phosphoheptulonate synthase [Calditerrivibrio sp.]